MISTTCLPNGPGEVPPRTLLLRCGTMFDGTKFHSAEEGSFIWIRTNDGIIETVTISTSAPWDDGELVDLVGSTVMPGLIDCHVHASIIDASQYQMQHLQMSSGYKALRSLNQLQAMLRSGWTTVRSAGDVDPYYPTFDARKFIEEKFALGPRIVGAGHYLSITGGGGDIHDIAPNQCQCFVPDGRIVDGKADMIRAVREEIKFGSDWIKLLVTGAYMTTGDDPAFVHFSDEEIEVAVAEAKRMGKRVMAHAHAASGVNAAVRAGVHSVEHGTFITEETAKLMIEKGTVLVPTLLISEVFTSMDTAGDDVGQLKKFVRTAKESDAESFRRLSRAIDMGVKVAVGSDCCGWNPSLNVKELILLHTRLGMSPEQVLRAATSSGAELLGLHEQVGRVTEGYAADLIAVRGDPSIDMESMKNVHWVLCGGEIVRSD